MTFIEYAAYYGSEKVVNYLLDKKYKVQKGSIIFAIYGSNLEIFKKLESQNVNYAKDEYKEWFMTAIYCFENEIALYIKNKYFDANNDNILNYQRKMILKNNYQFVDPSAKFDTYEISDFLDENIFNVASIIIKGNNVNVNGSLISKKINILIQF